MALQPISRENLDHTTRLLVELCAVSSASHQTEGLHAVASRLAGELEQRGLCCDIAVEHDAAGALLPVLAAHAGGTASRRLLLLGHLDTVLPAATPRLEGDRLIATGALDMKAGLAMFVGAIDELARRGRRPPEDLTFIAVPDEEVSGEVSQRVTRRWSEGTRAVLVLEPGALRDGVETLVAGRRGLTEWQLRVTGRAAHSGLAYWSGRSALVAAADWCLRAQRLSRPGPGPTVNVGRLVAGTAGFVDDLGSNHGLVGTSSQRNVIADHAIAEGEVRFLSAEEGAAAAGDLLGLVQQVATEHQVEAILTTERSIPPVDPRGPGMALARRVADLGAAHGLPLVIEEDRGGISFPNYFEDPSAVPVVDGLGPVGDGMHTREEWVDLRSLERRTGLLAELLATL